MPVATSTRSVVGDSGVSRIQTSVETTPKSDQQNLENLGLISPNEEEVGLSICVFIRCDFSFNY